MRNRNEQGAAKLALFKTLTFSALPVDHPACILRSRSFSYACLNFVERMLLFFPVTVSCCCVLDVHRSQHHSSTCCVEPGIEIAVCVQSLSLPSASIKWYSYQSVYTSLVNLSLSPSTRAPVFTYYELLPVPLSIFYWSSDMGFAGMCNNLRLSLSFKLRSHTNTGGENLPSVLCRPQQDEDLDVVDAVIHRCVHLPHSTSV